MFRINPTTNRIEKIEEKTFHELGFKEKENLQEWLANNPGALGEDLLVIQKEFSGFNETRERLDLLALDKQGNIVVIENKLDDSGRDVTWQVLKYASYCASLSKVQIIKIFQEYLDKYDPEKKSEDVLTGFFETEDVEEIPLNKGNTQRIMMVSGDFRKEVTSTVLWLLNYNVRIQCFKATPFKFGEELFLNIEQIIPMQEAEEYTISMAEKTKEDISSQEELKNRHVFRKEFWSKLLQAMNKKSSLFQNISPSNYGWIGTGSGVRGFGYNFVAGRKYGRCELYIDRGDKDENKKAFDEFLKEKEAIESKFGGKLEWERLDESRASRIKYEDPGFNLYDKDLWDKEIDFLTDGMVRFEAALKDSIKRIKNKI